MAEASRAYMIAKRALVVYQHLAHYRYGVFQSLQASEEWEFHFAANMQARDGIEVVNAEQLQHVHQLRNCWLGPLLWQKGLISLLLRNWDAVIFLGDAAYISTWTGAVLTRFIKKTPVLFWTIGWHKRESGLRRVYRLSFYRLANTLMLYGNTAKQFGVEMGYPRDKMCVIYNSSSGPHDMEGFVSPGEPQRNPFIIGAVIRLTPAKRLELLIQVAAVLQGRGHDVEVCIVGEGPHRSALENEAEKLGVRLTLPGGAYSQEELTAFYDRAAVTVIPTLAGLTTIQSMRYGRPVVTHDNMEEQVPEVEAIQPGITGGLYRYGNLQDLADVVEEWLLRQQENSCSVVDACHDRVAEGWTPEAQAERILGALNRCE